MSIPATQRLPGRRTWRFVFDASRMIAVLKFLHDVWIETWAMVAEAKRRYPYFE